MSEIREHLREFIIENFLFGQLEGKLDNGASLLKSGVIDSTGVLELLAFVQEHYGIKAEDEEIVPENIDSINNLVRFIERKQKEQAISN